MKKFVKYVEGKRVIKKHSVPSILVAFLAIVLTLVPFLFLTFNWAEISIDALPNAGAESVFASGFNVKVNGYELILAIFGKNSEGIINLYKAANEISNATADTNYLKIIQILVIASGCLYLLMVLFAFISFIVGFVFLFRGKLNKPIRVYKISWGCFINTLLFGVSSFLLSFLLNDKIAKASEASTPNWEYSNLTSAIWPHYIAVGVTLGLLILIGIFYLAGLRNTVYADDIIYEGKIVKNYLGKNTTIIADRQFERELALEIADIPDGITKLGVSSFANCVRLKKIFIPSSVKSLGANCFYNCVKVDSINYSGSKADWKKINKGSNWISKAGTKEIHCSDGVIVAANYETI